MIAAVRSTADLPQVEGVLGEAAQGLRRVDGLLHEHSLTKDGYFVGDAASLYSHVRDAMDALGPVPAGS